MENTISAQELETLKKNSDRYLIIREVILNPGLDEGYFHGNKVANPEEMDAAVDRLIDFITAKRKQ
jgi:hypothetical protein